MKAWRESPSRRLWIAFRFCIFVLWTQLKGRTVAMSPSCELLSDFVYSFFEHNHLRMNCFVFTVVNCFQILYIRSLNTMNGYPFDWTNLLWIAFRFCIFVLWTQSWPIFSTRVSVVNCFQILYIRSLNTIILFSGIDRVKLWIAFRFCIFVLWTQSRCRGISTRTCCELLSDFVYSFFEHNRHRVQRQQLSVVNCFQILYIRSLNTICPCKASPSAPLWIAFRFCIFVLWTQYRQE